MQYCKDALKWIKKEVVCGIDCPLYDKDCPRLIKEDRDEKTTEKMLEAMFKIVTLYSNQGEK